ncbi:MAG: hypothetical protein H6719_08345 [Sandaracinaceae bacterium]|nr:hypothetical protein [Sandaracinaceae bacterium]
MRLLLASALALLAVGCGDAGTVVIEVDAPVAAGQILVIQVAGEGVDPSRPLTAESLTVPLTGEAQHVCVRANGPAGDVAVRLRQCENATCTGGSDTVPRTHTATIEHGIYAGRTTDVRLGAFRVDSNAPVTRCEVRGCVDRVASTYCRLEDGAHFCEFSDDVPPALDACQVSLELSF